MRFALALFAAVVSTVPSDGIVHVRQGLTKAHACAVRPDVFLTARHVVEDPPVLGVAWSDLAGNEGVASVIYTDPIRDVAVLHVDRGKPGRAWAIATAAPKPGDHVRIVGYDDDKPAKPHVVEARVLDIDAGHVDYDKSPGYGSSGDCVLNDSDEVVAINNSFMPTPSGGVAWGTGVAVYGDWTPPLPEKE